MIGPAMGVFLHAIGGFCAGSFYTPVKKIETWAWESSWLVMGFAAWLIVPWAVTGMTVPNIIEVLKATDNSTLWWTYFFGLLWGAGGPIFGLTMRYLGVSLGMTVALGSGAAFGTLMPPIVDGTFLSLLTNSSGLLTLLGVIICLIGIALAGYAGHRRDIKKEKDSGEKSKFNVGKGILVTFLSGPLGACFAFGLAAGKPIAETAITHGTTPLWQNSPVLTVILLGGLTSNFILCVYANIRKKTSGDYLRKQADQGRNYFLASTGGVIWYLQFMFYGMGTSYMEEKFHFASWTIHMSFIILFSNLWGLYFKEWKGVEKNTLKILLSGLLTLVFSTIIISWGGLLETH